MEHNVTFKEKNQARKSARATAQDHGHTRTAINEGRRMRRVRWNGAFGQAPNHIYNLMAVGTSGELRNDNKSDDSDFIQVVQG